MEDKHLVIISTKKLFLCGYIFFYILCIVVKDGHAASSPEISDPSHWRDQLYPSNPFFQDMQLSGKESEARFETRIAVLQAENAQLRWEKDQLQQENSQLKKIIRTLHADIDGLRSEIDRLQTYINTTLNELAQEVRRIESELGFVWEGHATHDCKGPTCWCGEWESEPADENEKQPLLPKFAS